VGGADSLAIAEEPAGGSGTVVATSPIYMITDDSTAGQIEQAGGGWRALADLVTSDSGVRMAVRDPGGSGDGLVAVGAVAEAVWIDDGMDASAEALMTALPSTRTVPSHAIPEENGEVGLVADMRSTARRRRYGCRDGTRCHVARRLPYRSSCAIPGCPPWRPSRTRR
jgi:hypothetical protein